MVKFDVCTAILGLPESCVEVIEKVSFNNSPGYFGVGRKIGNWTIVGEVFFYQARFFLEVV